MSVPVRPAALKEQQGKNEDFDCLNPAPEGEVAGNDGLGHHGEPEVEVVEEAEKRWWRNHCHKKPAGKVRGW